jgi:hypothetical protein
VDVGRKRKSLSLLWNPHLRTEQDEMGKERIWVCRWPSANLEDTLEMGSLGKREPVKYQGFQG